MKVFDLVSVVIFLLGSLLIQCDKEESEVPIANLNYPFFTITDREFLKALIEEGVDTNGDSLISLTEAESITTLDVGDFWGGFIKDMTGIEAFINLDSLSCNGNEISELDLTHNTKLKYLDAWGRSELRDGGGFPGIKLVSLNISECTELEYLRCSANELSDLDLSNHTKLKELRCANNLLEHLYLYNNTLLECLNCSGNLLESLYLYNNPLLEELRCGRNRMTSLDISRNTALKYLSITDDLLLSKVCVWELPFPPEGMIVEIEESPNVNFTTECSQ